MPTIKDVAKLAGVSIATVSNYLNHTRPVSRQTAARIQEAVDQLQYAANLSAKSLRSNSYTEVGVILPNLNDPYYVQIFQGIEHAFSGTQYYVNVAFSYDIPEMERSIAENYLKKQVCGLILISCIPDDWKFYYHAFTARGKSIVMIDRRIKGLDANFLSFDYGAVMEQLTKELLQRHSRLTLMAGPAQFTCEAACISGFRAACDRAGVPEQVVVHTDLNRESAVRTTMGLLRTDTPEVVIATSEATATGIMEALALLGHNDGEVPVVTLGEEHWNKFTHSFATFSTARPAIRMGQMASQTLLDQLEAPHLQETQQIILRDSSTDKINLVSEPQQPAAERDRTQPLKLLMLQVPAVETFQNLLKNFTQKTGIQVQVTTLPHDKLSREILDRPSGASYDIVMYDIPWLPMLASQGVLRDISDWLVGMDTDIFFPGCLQHYSLFRGGAYGIPFIYAPQIFFYRKDLFEEPRLREDFELHFGMSLRPPITLKEYNAIAEFFTDRTDAIPYGISVAAAYTECLAPELYTRMNAYGSRLFGSGGRVTLDSPETLQAYINLKRALRWAKPDYMQANDVSIIDDFLRGETAMLIGYPAYMTDVTDLRKSSMIGSIGYSLIPGRAPLLGGWGLGLHRDCCNEAGALAFLKWMCSEQTGNYFALMGGQTTITSTYTNDELVKLYPWLPMYYSAYESASPTVVPELPNGRILSSEQVDETVCSWLYRAIRDEIDLPDAIAATHRDLEKLVREALR